MSNEIEMNKNQKSSHPLLMVSLLGAVVAGVMAAIAGLITGPLGFVLKFFIGLENVGMPFLLVGFLFIPVLGAMFSLAGGFIGGPIAASIVYTLLFERTLKDRYTRRGNIIGSVLLGGLIAGIIAALIGGFIAGLTLNPMSQ